MIPQPVLRILALAMAFVVYPASHGSDYQHLPQTGDMGFHVLSPEVLEVSFINSKKVDQPVEQWNLAGPDGALRLPQENEVKVMSGAQRIALTALGFRRRVVYAPLRTRDLRIGNSLYLKLERPLRDGEVVEFSTESPALWGRLVRLTTTNHVHRLSEVIHVNQTGYHPQFPKKAFLGYYSGSLGELDLSWARRFKLLTADLKKEVFAGNLTARPDQGFTFPCYHGVLEADFTAFNQQGEYRLVVDGLGISYPFFIDEGYPAALARTYALGLYHQRCGASNALPFTRFVHGPCHLQPAEVPVNSFTNTQKFLAQDSANATNNVRHTAPVMKDFASALYGFVRTGAVDVSKGHHDAGDYSKYTINSAGLIHHLVFAVDAFPGVGELDNLGLPESGDGLSDLLQEAKWEADFLVKMQDEDGGFYFLVYPKERRYEHNVLPDAGDPQIVWPKTTASTAAAVAALAQTGSSPLFQKQFPDASKRYLESARKGWTFLERAIEKHGKDGAYQKITHYGDDFMHDDELAWAACELYAATGEGKYHKRFQEWFQPNSPASRKWGWWRLYEAYGNATRSYAFAQKSGRLKQGKLNPLMVAQCENELARGAEDQLARAQSSAYGTSFPVETKRVRSAGWYFSSGAAFDLAVGCQLAYPVNRDLRPKFLEALVANFSYEMGSNPVNVSFLTGLGFKRPLEIVHHYAQNDRRMLPPSGIPVGNLQAGFGWLDFYKRELGELTFPPDGSGERPYPIYDRWGDSFNVQTEFVIVNQGRALGAAAWLMAQGRLKQQSWRATTGLIEVLEGSNRARLRAAGLDLTNARIIWETPEGAQYGTEFRRLGGKPTPAWIEVEAWLPDGRRIVAVTNLVERAK